MKKENRIKQDLNNNETDHWWLRSAAVDYDKNVACIDYDGSVYDDYANSESGISSYFII